MSICLEIVVESISINCIEEMRVFNWPLPLFSYKVQDYFRLEPHDDYFRLESYDTVVSPSSTSYDMKRMPKLLISV